MAFGDRLNISIKDFGRRVVITARRGTIELSDDRKTATVNYRDDETRRKKLPRKAK